jgi:hypothetical protein
MELKITPRKLRGMRSLLRFKTEFKSGCPAKAARIKKIISA